ncbi:MAG: hypothetical protein JHC93_01090 [Parachlamydiales bacterium]|nr:hypothetical protein [Parachlamydiales bacterium]
MKSSSEGRSSEYDMLREALANLNSIAECESLADLVITEDNQLALPKKGDVAFLTPGSKEDSSRKVEVMRSTFRYVLEYIRRIYNKENGVFRNKATLQGIQTIMVLVGEVANKLDRYTSIFKKAHGQTVVELKEYKDLQEFYQNKIMKPMQERLLLGDVSQKILKDSVKPVVINVEEKAETEQKLLAQALSNLDAVKEDGDYDLFYLYKEDGTPFFNESLIKDIQNAYNANIHEDQQYVGDDPFLQVKNWEDKLLLSCCQQGLTSIRSPLEAFYHEALKHQDHEVVSSLHKGLMALMLGSSAKNLLRHFSVKSCYQYFVDFQIFLRQAMRSGEYYKLLDRPPRKTQRLLASTMDIIHTLCLSLYTHVQPRQELIHGLEAIVERAPKKTQPPTVDTPSVQLDYYYEMLGSVIKHFPNGPLFKALDLVIEGQVQTFDPLLLAILPHMLFNVYMGEKSFSVLNIASPTAQTFIHKAVMVDEFKGFLRSYAERKKMHLLINLQDRTSWKEYARSHALEELQMQAEYTEHYSEATLTKDTDFYYQLAPYHNLDDVEGFITQFKEHLSSLQSGFYFPARFMGALFPEFIDHLLNGIHSAFFHQKLLLNRRQRLDFIEIAYFFIQLKLIEISDASSVSFTCKDSLDVGSTASVQFFLLLKLLNGQKVEDMDAIMAMLFIPALLHRERMIDHERFTRMMNVLKFVEAEVSGLKNKERQTRFQDKLGPLFDLPLFNTQITVPEKESV